MWEEVAPKGGREARRALISSLSRAGSGLGLRTDQITRPRPGWSMLRTSSPEELATAVKAPLHGA